MQVDIFNRIKSRIGISKLFSQLYPSHFRLSENSLCPFHEDTNNSLKLYNDHFHCFGCGAHGDVIHLYALKHNLSEGEAAHRLAIDHHLIDDSTCPLAEQNEVESTETSRAKQPEEVPDFMDRYAFLVKQPLHRGAYIYLKRRGFTKEFIDRLHENCGLAWSRRLKRLVFPIENAEQTSLVGLQTISLKKEDKAEGNDKKLARETSLAAGFYFYGEPSAPYVVVTESIFDALSCVQALPECAVVSILSATSIEKLRSFRGLTIFLDNDKGGREGSHKILEAEPNFKFVDWGDLQEKDANDLLKAGKLSELRKLITSAALPTVEFRERLEQKILEDKGVEIAENTIPAHPFPVCEETKEHDVCLHELTEAEKAVDRALDVHRDKVIEASAGVGKSGRAIEKAWKKVEEGKLILYCQPNHKLIDSTIANFIPDQGRVLHFYGRSAMRSRYSPRVCPHAERLRKPEQLGLSPGLTVCSSCTYEKEHREKCKYREQIQKIAMMKSGIIFAATDGLDYLLELNENIAEVILDEVSTKVMIKEVSVSQRDFEELEVYSDAHPEFLEMTQSLRSLINRVKKAMKEKRNRAARFYNQQPGAITWHDKKLIWDYLKISQTEFCEKVTPALDTLFSLDQKQLLEMNVNLDAVKWLAAFAGSTFAPNELAWIAVDSKKGESAVSFTRLVRTTLPKRENSPYSITILDATCDYDELKFLYGRDFIHTKVEVPWEGERIWIKHRGVGKESMEKMSEAKIKKYAKLACDQLKPGVTTAFIVTHQIAEKKVLKAFKKVRPDIDWMIDHYHATRGKNDYKVAQAVICFGVPVINPSALIDIAGTLFPGDFERQNRWLQRQSENELYQSAHRARMVRFPGRQLIVIGHYFPEHLLGKVTRTIELGRLDSKVEKAVDRFLGYADKLGIFSKEVAAALKVCEAANEEKARKIHEPARKSLDIELPDSEWIVSAKANFWPEILEAIKMRRPDLIDFRIRLIKWDKQNYTRAVGTETAVNELQIMGIEVKK